MGQRFSFDFQVPGHATNGASVEGFFWPSYMVVSLLSGAIQEGQIPTVVAKASVWPRGSPKGGFAPLIVSLGERWDEILLDASKGFVLFALTASQTCKRFFYLFPLSPGVPDSL